MEYYQILKNLREDNDLTQKNISEKYYLGKNTYYNYENGKREMPFRLAIELAKLYKVSLDYIAGITKCKSGLYEINSDERKILELYKNLSERRKGKAELYLEQLSKQQAKEEQNIQIVENVGNNSPQANISISNGNK